MSWRLAGCLEQLRKQVNTLAPNRSKASDGSIGDAAHQATKSEHNPDANGVVRAIDITHDPSKGMDCQALADSLIASQDPRIMYVIWNYRICSRTVSPWKWRKYTGSNPHNHHLHISVEGNYDDTREWNIKVVSDGTSVVTSAPTLEKEILFQGKTGEEVKKLQALLNRHGAKLDVDGDFGPRTKDAVMKFQRKFKLTPDGIVGPYTWDKLST